MKQVEDHYSCTGTMLSKAHGAAPTDREFKPLKDVMSPYLRALYEDEVRPMLDYFRNKEQLMTAQEKARKDASTLQERESALAESAADGTARARWLQEKRPEREEKVAKARQALAKSQACVAEAQGAFNRLVTASGHSTEEDLISRFKLMQRCPPPPKKESWQEQMDRFIEYCRRSDEVTSAATEVSASSDDDGAAPHTAKRLRPDITTAAPFRLPLQGLPVDVIGCVASYLPTRSAVAGLACTCKALHAHVLASLTRIAVPLMGDLDYVVPSFPRVSHVVITCAKGFTVQLDVIFWLRYLIVNLHERLRGLEVLLREDDSRSVVALLCEVDWPKLELLYVKRHLALVMRAARVRPLRFLPNLHSLGSEAQTDFATDDNTIDTEESDDEDGRSDQDVRVGELIDARSNGHLPKLQRIICRRSYDYCSCSTLVMCPDLNHMKIVSAAAYERDLHRLLTILRSTKFPRLRYLDFRLNSMTEVQQVVQALNSSGSADCVDNFSLDLHLDTPGPPSNPFPLPRGTFPSLRTLNLTTSGHVAASDVSIILHTCGSSLERLTLKHESSGGKRQGAGWLPAVLSDQSYTWLGSIKELVLAPSRATKIKEAELAFGMKALLRRTVILSKLTLPEGRDGAVVAVLDVLKEDGCLPRLHQVYMTDWSGPRSARPMPGSGATLLVAAWLSHKRAAHQASGGSGSVGPKIYHGPYRSQAVRDLVASLQLKITTADSMMLDRMSSSSDLSD